MHLLIVGTGYVGLVTGACFAEMGHHVICLDVDEEKIINLQQGRLPFFEPGLLELVERNIEAGRLSFTTCYAEGVERSDVCFLALPTPAGEEGACDLSYVLAAARAIAQQMQGYKLIVNKSTVPVGSVERVSEVIREALATSGRAIDFDVVSNPEFLKEGSAVADCMKPERVIIGTKSPRALSLMKQIYSTFTLNHDRMLLMDPASAEMTKYAANAMLATRISFMNELAGLCEKKGANINAVRVGIGADSRIGYQFLYAGIGYGGSCFPKDIRALQAMAKEVSHPTPLLNAVTAINERQKRLLIEKIERYFEGELQGKVFAIWGLSFKPGTDDMREAPSIDLIKALYAAGATLRLFDPVAMPSARAHLLLYPKLCWCSDEYEAACGADAVLLVTEWKQFRVVECARILKAMRGTALFDGRNQYKPEAMRAQGFDYFAVGVPEADTQSVTAAGACGTY